MKQRKEFRAFGLNFVFGGMLIGGSYEANFGTDRRKAWKNLDRSGRSQVLPDAD